MARTFTLISTSGWQGAGWSFIGEYDTLADAEAARDTIATSNAREDGYITRITTATLRGCMQHQYCYVARLSGTGPAHLVGRQVHISDYPVEVAR